MIHGWISIAMWKKYHRVAEHAPGARSVLPETWEKSEYF